jgi:hypothetical protein
MMWKLNQPMDVCEITDINVKKNESF